MRFHYCCCFLPSPSDGMKGTEWIRASTRSRATDSSSDVLACVPLRPPLFSYAVDRGELLSDHFYSLLLLALPASSLQALYWQVSGVFRVLLWPRFDPACERAGEAKKLWEMKKYNIWNTNCAGGLNRGLELAESRLVNPEKDDRKGLTRKVKRNSRKECRVQWPGGATNLEVTVPKARC